MSRSPILASLFISICICIGIISLRNKAYLEFLELSAYDRYLSLQTKISSPDSRIVLITVSEEDIQRLGKWPLTDSSLAQILETLLTYKPRAIGLDIYRDIPVPPGKEALASVFSHHQKIVTVTKIGDKKSKGVPAPYILEDTDLVGFNDTLVDTDGITRRGLLFLDNGENTYYSFSLLLALLYLEAEGITPQSSELNSSYLRLGKTLFVPFESNDGGYRGADARGYQFLLNFRGARAGFKSFSLTELLAGKVHPDKIQDKIVIIGAAAESLHDLFFIPMSKGSGYEQRIFGVELHAHIVSQLLHSAIEGDKPISCFHDHYEWVWILIWGLLGGTVALFRPALLRFSLFVTSGLLFLVLITFSLFTMGWWIPVVPTAFTWLISAALVTAFLSHREKVQKAQLMQLFSRHVSGKIAETLWQQREQFMDGGRPRSQKLTATVLFSDLEGFTSLSEKLDPSELMNWLNEYMETMAQQVIDHDGVIDKYIGDAIMAVFGIPLARTQEAEISRDALQAVDCALAMSQEMNRLNVLWKKRNLPTTRVRIGIFTGPVVAGSLGSQKRMEYTVLGDTVNTASRLEGLYKNHQDPDDSPENACRIFIGEETLRHLGERFLTKMVGCATLKGKVAQINVYRVIGRKDQN